MLGHDQNILLKCNLRKRKNHLESDVLSDNKSHTNHFSDKMDLSGVLAGFFFFTFIPFGLQCIKQYYLYSQLFMAHTLSLELSAQTNPKTCFHILWVSQHHAKLTNKVKHHSLAL